MSTEFQYTDGRRGEEAKISSRMISKETNANLQPQYRIKNPYLCELNDSQSKINFPIDLDFF